MLELLGVLLKVVGIVLLVILAFAVLLVCSVLFLPVRYRAEVSGSGRVEQIGISVQVSWMFHLFSGWFAYRDGKTDWQFRIFWKKLHTEKKSRKRKKKRKRQRRPEKKQPETACDRKAESREKEQRAVLRTEEGETEQAEERKQKKAQDTPEEKQSFLEKVGQVWHNLCETLERFGEGKERAAEFLEDAGHKLAFSKAKTEVFRLLRFLKPKKLKGRFRFGFEDPYKTGQILALLSMLYPFYGETITIYPEFEGCVFEGELLVKGHIRAIYFVIPLWNLLFSKHVRMTYKHIRAFEF